MATLHTGRPTAGAIMGVSDANGTTVWLNVNCEPLWRDHAPLPHAAVASFTDVSARRRAEDEQREASVELERRVRERTADLALLNDMLAGELRERQRTEGELRRAHDELEMRVHERTADLILVNRSLQEAKDAAELASVSKSRFLATMSHELRTPLNSVIGFASILLKNKHQRLGPPDLAYLSRIHENGRHLLGLINDLLDLSKIEAGRLELARAPVDLSALILDLEQQLGGHALTPSVRLVRDMPPGLAAIETDETRLKQVLLNLLGNALKFTHEGAVTVRVTADPATGRPEAIAVSDTGIGIAPDRLGAIFEAFQQADNTTERRYGGTGLGLAISRSLLHAMGHGITVESRLGEGSTFTIHLNAAPDNGAPTTAPAPRETGETVFDGRRVLVIDDESDSRIVLRQYLEDFGCIVRTSEGGEDGIDQARDWRPDLVTLDLRLPGMHGEEVLRRLTSDPDLSRIPVVVISIVGAEYRTRLPAAAHVLDKPVTRESLRAALAPRLWSR